MPLFGYARVSTRDAKTDRPELVKAIGRLEPSDVEPRGNAQCTNLIASSPGRTDLVGLAVHVASSTAPTGATL
jgi:hypothetical protein